MALLIGSAAADAGMSKAIYDQVDSLLSPPLLAAVNGASGDARAKAQEALDGARDGWRKLAFAVAKGVVDHIVANMEVAGLQASGSVNATVSGNTGSVAPGPHLHTVGLQGTQAGVKFTQSNPGTGLVR